jgi:hypothetical protein
VNCEKNNHLLRPQFQADGGPSNERRCAQSTKETIVAARKHSRPSDPHSCKSLLFLLIRETVKYQKPLRKGSQWSHNSNGTNKLAQQLLTAQVQSLTCTLECVAPFEPIKVTGDDSQQARCPTSASPSPTFPIAAEGSIRLQMLSNMRMSSSRLLLLIGSRVSLEASAFTHQYGSRYARRLSTWAREYL